MSAELLAGRARDYRERAAALGCPDDGSVTGPALADLLASHPDCYLCGARLDQAEFDHVRPLKGDRVKGSNVIANVLPACLACNRKKGTRSLTALGRRLRSCELCYALFAEEGLSRHCGDCQRTGLPAAVRETQGASRLPEVCERARCSVALAQTGRGRPRRTCSAVCQRAVSRHRRRRA